MELRDFGQLPDRLGVLASQLDDALSGQRPSFQRALNGHVATGGRDAAEGLDDLFQFSGSGFDLGNDRDATGLPSSSRSMSVGNAVDGDDVR